VISLGSNTLQFGDPFTQLYLLVLGTRPPLQELHERERAELAL